MASFSALDTSKFTFKKIHYIFVYNSHKFQLSSSSSLFPYPSEISQNKETSEQTDQIWTQKTPDGFSLENQLPVCYATMCMVGKGLRGEVRVEDS